jgi:hypothetical protein
MHGRASIGNQVCHFSTLFLYHLCWVRFVVQPITRRPFLVLVVDGFYMGWEMSGCFNLRSPRSVVLLISCKILIYNSLYIPYLSY